MEDGSPVILDLFGTNQFLSCMSYACFILLKVVPCPLSSCFTSLYRLSLVRFSGIHTHTPSSFSL